MGFFEQGWSFLPELAECNRYCRSAAASIRALIYIRNLGVKPRGYTHQGEPTNNVLNMLALAEEGYTLYKRASEFTKSEERDLIEETTPMSSDVFNTWLKAHGFSEISSPLKILNASSQASAYRTLRGALDKLLEIKRVTFEDFIQVDDLNLGMAESQITWWNRNLTADNVWVILQKARRNLELIYETPIKIDPKNLLETGHFFTAAAQFSSPPKVL